MVVLACCCQRRYEGAHRVLDNFPLKPVRVFAFLLCANFFKIKKASYKGKG